MNMLKCLFFVLIGFCSAHVLGAKEDFSQLFYAVPPIAHIDTVVEPSFRSVMLELKSLVASRGKEGNAQHFCVVGYRFEDGSYEAVVHWINEKRLIGWSGSDALEFKDAHSLAFAKTLDLNTDLVEKIDDINGSTFLTVRSQAEAVVADCEEHGVHYTVEPFVPPSEEE